ncbi:MAG: shikimate dehydrogenase [Actinobacteria bacterium]|nr:shikimate dehydrogenase [Actinomycetota bacterium]NBY15848.1 shikimate dehydrogenase [Actinomycetota bacterium]
MKAAVLGKPILHSLSPAIHTAGYQAQNLPHTYSAIEIAENELAAFVSNCDEQWLGLSLTMPLKVAAFSVAEELTPLVQLTGSINTLVFADQIVAYNTDVYGIVRACQESEIGAAKTCSILGSGATARSAIVAAHELGVQQIHLVARNPEAILVCDEIATELGITFQATSADNAQCWESDLVINTTPAGVADTYLKPELTVSGLLLDVVYRPWPTVISSQWEDAGGRSCPGHLMLLHQAVAQYELFTGQSAPLKAMRAALEASL